MKEPGLGDKGLLSLLLVAALGPAWLGGDVLRADDESRQLVVVLRAQADVAGERLTIEGRHLGPGRHKRHHDHLRVTLAGEPLTVLGATDSTIVAQLPPRTRSGAIPSSALRVSEWVKTL